MAAVRKAKGNEEDQPNEEQTRILRAYARTPNKAAVARRAQTHERHVRRVVSMFPKALDRFRQEEEEKREEWNTELEQWARTAIRNSLERLDTLANSEIDQVATKVLKLRIDTAFRILQGAAEDLEPEIAAAEHELNILDSDSDGLSTGGLDEDA